MATPASLLVPRTRSADERLAEQLGGEDKRRKLVAAIADALELGGPTTIEFESDPSRGGLILRVPTVHHGRRAW